MPPFPDPADPVLAAIVIGALGRYGGGKEMTDRQWHTAAPAPPQKQQENLIPQGNTILGLNPKYQDNLVSLIRLLILGSFFATL